MSSSFTFLTFAFFCGAANAQFGLPPSPYNNRPEDAQFMPRYSAGSGNTNYNNYNGANDGNSNNGGSGDSLASLGLGGLSGFYSALTNELQYAGNNVGGPTKPTLTSTSPTVKPVESVTESDLDTAYAISTTFASTTKLQSNDKNGYSSNNNNNNNNNDNYNNFGGQNNGNSPFGGSGYGGNSPFGGGQGGNSYGGPSPFTGQAGPGFGGSPFGGQGGPGFGGGQGGPGGYGGDSPFGGPGGSGYGGGQFGGSQNGPNYDNSPSNNAASVTPPTGPINLGDTSMLKNMGLEQLGSFFGSMVSELNNAGAQVGGPTAAVTTPKSLAPSKLSPAATTSSSR